MPTPTLVPLETLREQLSYHPYHFWEFAGGLVPLTDNCLALVREFAWQSYEAAGREEMRQKIAFAEGKLRDYLVYDVGTVYNSETIDVGFLKVLGNNGGWWPFSSSSGWAWGWSPALATLRVGKLTRIATMTRVSLGNAAVTLSDSTGVYGLYDTFTATLANATANVTAVEAYVPVADQFPIARPLAEWQIRPVTVTRLNPATIQVQGPAWILAKPKLYANPVTSPTANYKLYGVDSAGAIDPTQAGNYLSSIDLYERQYTNENAATLITDDCGTVTTAPICATIADHGLGTVRLDFSTCAPSNFVCTNANATQRVQINYEAGDDTNKWSTVVCRFALAELRKRISACESANQEIFRWQQDVSQVATGGTEGFRVDTDILGNPFGTRRGQVEAWNAVTGSNLYRGINVASFR